jgi:hypothetical protein
MNEYFVSLHANGVIGFLTVTAKTTEAAIRKMKKILVAARKDTLFVRLEEIERL